MLRAILFDINGTLIDIDTDEDREDIYRAIGHFLLYQGIALRRGEVRELYFRILDEQRRASRELYPEFDAVAIWRDIITCHATNVTRALPREKLDQLPLVLAELYRGISRKRLQLYPDAINVLARLSLHYRLAAVTDAQSAWAVPELHATGLLDYLNPIIVSGDYGYRKPDTRLFEAALEQLQVSATEAIYVGNDMYRDIYGAQQAGMKAVFLASSRQGDKYRLGVQPDYVIHHLSELAQAIPHLEKSTLEYSVLR